MKFVMLIVVIATSFCVGCGQSDEVLQQRYLEIARASLRQGAYEQALLALNRISAISPQSKEFYLIQGLAYFKIREFHHAMDAFEKATPSSLALKRYMGYLHLLLGEVEQAAALLEEIQVASGSTQPLPLLNGNIQLRKQAFAASRISFDEAILHDEHPAQAYIGLGNVALFEKDVATAEQHYLSATLVAPDHIHVYHVLSKFYIYRIGKCIFRFQKSP